MRGLNKQQNKQSSLVCYNRDLNKLHRLQHRDTQRQNSGRQIKDNKNEMRKLKILRNNRINERQYSKRYVQQTFQNV